VAVSVLALAPCGFFTHTTPAARQFAAAHMRLVYLKRREVMGDGAQPFDGLGMVLQGSLQALDLTLDGREAALMTVLQYESFGHANLLAARPVALTWVASSGSTTVAVMPSEQAQELMQFPEVALGVARLLAQEVCDLLGWQKIQSVNPVSARVCAWLQLQTNPGLASRLPTHAEIAWRLNTTRETVTRVLQRLLTEGVLLRDGEVWLVAQPALLRDLARGEER
jgi:CRP/FNR family cyclic AMP-dependent transcriptional regulator